MIGVGPKEIDLSKKRVLEQRQGLVLLFLSHFDLLKNTFFEHFFAVDCNGVVQFLE